MQNGIFTLNLASFKSALVSTVLMAIVAMAGYIIGLGDLWKIDLHSLTNIGVMALLTGIVSLIKNFLTSDAGNFAGIVKVD
jgi:hypothetical protein